MKKILFFILLFVGIFAFQNCIKNEANLNETFSKDAQFDFKSSEINITKTKFKIFENIEDFKLVTTSDGFVFLFDKGITTYANVISIIQPDLPKNLNVFFDSKPVSIIYKFNRITFINNDKQSMQFIVNNKKVRVYYDKINDKTNVFLSNQLGLAYKCKFNIPDVDKVNTPTNEWLKSILLLNKFVEDDSKKCTSGGEGSTECSVGDTFSNCSVSCGDGYYACCDGSTNTCFCVAK